MPIVFVVTIMAATISTYQQYAEKPQARPNTAKVRAELNAQSFQQEQ